MAKTKTKEEEKTGTKSKTKTLKYVYATGKRRTSSARVRLYKGKGENTINEKKLQDYFPLAVQRFIWERPFKLTGTEGKYFVSVKVLGGGVVGQLEAVAHGIAKALSKADKDKYRPPLKKAGLLTRDSRIRERRKVGMGGKSRRKKQSPKR